MLEETLWLQNVIEREPIEIKADRSVNVKWIVKM
jgi:hypothetical protein